MFVKVIRKIGKRLIDIQKQAISAEMKLSGPAPTGTSRVDVPAPSDDWKPMSQIVAEELDEAGDKVKSALREKQREMLDSLDLKK